MVRLLGNQCSTFPVESDRWFHGPEDPMPNQKPLPELPLPESLDVAAIRAKTRYRSGFWCYTQANFARLIGVPPGTLRQWEQGRRQPTGAARVLLAMVDREPDIVARTLTRPAKSK
jgi:putative transcriptional regulator